MYRQGKQDRERKYRGWTIVCERCYVQVGRGYGGTFLWECRAYKDKEARAKRATNTDVVGEGVETGVTELQEITPARSFDDGVAHREACTRIDRWEKAQTV